MKISYFTSDILKNPCVEIALEQDVTFRLGMFEAMLRIFFNREGDNLHFGKQVMYFVRPQIKFVISDATEGFLKSSAGNFPYRLFLLDAYLPNKYKVDIREPVEAIDWSCLDYSISSENRINDYVERNTTI